MVDVMSYALEFIGSAGLVAVFILLVLDSAMLLPAVPGEVVLIIAVALWGDDPLGLMLVLAIAVAAGMVGALLVYAVGAKAAGRALRKRKSVLGISPKRLDKMQRVFARPSGQFLLFLGRLFPLTRIVVSLPAGIARMPVWRYTIITLLGTTLFYSLFLWITYQFSREDSEIQASADGVRAALATPAWEYIEANWILSALVVIVVGVVLSVRASRRMAEDPEETSGSLIGLASRMALFWGGGAILVGLWVDRTLVYRALAIGGVDAGAWHVGLPFEPDSILVGVAGVAVAVAAWLQHVRVTARRRNRELRRSHDKLAFQGRLKPAELRKGRPRGVAPAPKPPADWSETHKAGPTDWHETRQAAPGDPDEP